MPEPTKPFDLSMVKVFPLAERKSITRLEDMLVQPDQTPAPLEEPLAKAIDHCANQILHARKEKASVLLFYGAHLLRNGAALILDQMI